MAASETLEEGCKRYGNSDADVDALVNAINDAAAHGGLDSQLVSLTERAAAKVREFADGKLLGLRVSFAAGGWVYNLDLQDAPEDGDDEFVEKGVRVFVPRADVEKLRGCRIDFLDAQVGGGFTIRNPNAPADSHALGVGGNHA